MRYQILGVSARSLLWGLAGRFFGAGEIRRALLSLVAEGARHGYELMKKLEERASEAFIEQVPARSIRRSSSWKMKA